MTATLKSFIVQYLIRSFIIYDSSLAAMNMISTLKTLLPHTPTQWTKKKCKKEKGLVKKIGL